jgi:16S rRNA (cytosine1402-N4)-methyltransferase
VTSSIDREELQQIFSEFGEVRNARTLSEAIVSERVIAPIATTEDLVRIAGTVSKGPANKYLAQVFQALRIAVNDEVTALKEFLEQSLDMLKPGGRLVVISYHSLEDRLVKQFMKWGGFGAEPEKDLYGNFPQPFKQITRKPIIPDDREVKINPRARSARLRIAEKK